MPFVSYADTRRTEVKTQSGELKATNYVYFGEGGGREGIGPQAFLVDSPAGRLGHPHFHNVDQYQVFFPAAGATYKKLSIDSPLLHYTDAFTSYGPYASGPDESLTYLTLRARHSSVTAYVPEERAKLPKAQQVRRQVTLPLGRAMPQGNGETQVTPLISPDHDGLAAYLIEAGPHTAALLPAAARPSGQYCCVLDGSVVDGGLRFEHRAVRWDDDADGVTTMTAGESGARMLVLRFPSPPTTQR